MRSLLPIVLACIFASACATSVTAPEPPPWKPYKGTLFEYAGSSEAPSRFTERVLTRLAGGDVDGAARLLKKTESHTGRQLPPATVVRARGGDLKAIVDLMRIATEPSVERPWLLLAAAEGLMETHPRAAAHIATPVQGTSASGLAARALILRALVAGGRTNTATERLAAWLGDPATRLKDVPLEVVRRLPAQATVAAETERGWLLLDAREHHRAAVAFKRSIAMGDSSTDQRCWALSGDATAKLYQQRQTDSRKALTRALDACPQHETAPRLEILLARVAFVGEDEATFEDAVARVRARGQDHAVRNGIHTLPLIRRAEGDLAEVRGMLQRRYRVWPFSDSTASLVMRVWHDLNKSRSHSRAAAVLAPLVEAEYNQDRTSLRGQLDYWMGTSLEAMGHPEASRMTHGRNVLRNPLTWYGLLSLQSIQKTDPEGAEELRALVPQYALDAEPGAQWAALEGGLALEDDLKVLAWWGLGDAITAVAKEHKLHNHAGRSLWVSRILSDIGAHQAGARLAQSALDTLGVRSPTTGNLALWRAAYPQAFRGQVLNNAEQHHIEPELVWAIMRVESYYNTAAVSRAGARGLMQVMPTTARFLLWVAGRAGARVDLFDPPENIQMSVGLLARLSHRFEERKPLMLAAYNAGSGRVKRWLDESSASHLDRFVEEMPIAQARHYVRSVTGAWAIYQYLGECGCVADLSDDLRRLAGP